MPAAESQTRRPHPLFSGLLEAEQDSQRVLDEPESGRADGSQSTDETAAGDRSDSLAEHGALSIQPAVRRGQLHLGRNRPERRSDRQQDHEIGRTAIEHIFRDDDGRPPSGLLMAGRRAQVHQPDFAATRRSRQRGRPFFLALPPGRREPTPRGSARPSASA